MDIMPIEQTVGIKIKMLETNSHLLMYFLNSIAVSMTYKL